MRAVVQRVTESSVTVDNEIVGEIGRGLMVLLGVTAEDKESDVSYLAGKICQLRIFDDGEGKMNRSLEDIHGEMLVVSQFTLYGDCRKGRRPSFSKAAPPEQANQLYEQFVEAVRGRGLNVATGIFQAHMDVSLNNDGPVTMLIDSSKEF
ncbi:MAG: D-tyrosyl-tRNA(Tyr) deacylase [Pirellulaceae bacterium]|jgi:D-tyrosyl-tRNA(Tyr) deacylase